MARADVFLTQAPSPREPARGCRFISLLAAYVVKHAGPLLPTGFSAGLHFVGSLSMGNIRIRIVGTGFVARPQLWPTQGPGMRFQGLNAR
jgi:hypothetical protein